MGAMTHGECQAQKTHGPEPHGGPISSPPRETENNFRLWLVAPTPRLFLPHRTTKANQKEKIGPLDTSFICDCKWIQLQQGEWEGSCIAAGHLGSWLQRTPSCPAFWLRGAESTGRNWTSWTLLQAGGHTGVRSGPRRRRGCRRMDQLLPASPHLLLKHAARGGRPNDADHEHQKRPKGRITVKLLRLLSAWLKYDGYLTHTHTHTHTQTTFWNKSSCLTFPSLLGQWQRLFS